MNKQTYVEKAYTFFRVRFPHNLYDSGKVKEYAENYYNEWIDRFESGKPELYMDSQSLEIYNKLKEKYGW